jgi:hypothetical protein
MQLPSVIYVIAILAAAVSAHPISPPEAGKHISRDAAQEHWLKYSGLHRTTLSPSVAAAMRQARQLEEAKAAKAAAAS